MKPPAIIVTTILLILLAKFTTSYIENTAKEFEPVFARLEAAVMEEDWASAAAEVAVVTEKWDAIRFHWRMLIDHLEVDRIEQSITRLQEYLRVEDRTHSLNEMAVLQKLIEHIPELDKLNLSNVF